MTVQEITDRHTAPGDVDVNHLAQHSDILEAIRTRTMVVTLCGVRRRPILPVGGRPVCEACARISVGIR